MSDTLIIAMATLAGIAIVAAALLHGWSSWIALRNREIELQSAPPRDHARQVPGCAHTLARIEMASLRERVRQLEAAALPSRA